MPLKRKFEGVPKKLIIVNCDEINLISFNVSKSMSINLIGSKKKKAINLICFLVMFSHLLTKALDKPFNKIILYNISNTLKRHNTSTQVKIILKN